MLGEPCTRRDVKAYKPVNKSTGAGQVLHVPYKNEKVRIIIQEMTNLLALTVGSDISNLTNVEICKIYDGEVKIDSYGRQVPKHSRGTVNLKRMTSSSKLIREGVMTLFDEIVNPILLVRRVNIVANHIIDEKSVKDKFNYEHLDLFTDYNIKKINEEEESIMLEK